MTTVDGLPAALARAGFAALAWGERIAEELAYAAALLERHPELAGEWKPRLPDAAGRVVEAARSGEAGRLRDAVLAIEAEFAPLVPTAQSYVVHAAGHAHIDMNWMWSWQETAAITHDTFLTVLRLMEEFPEFHFSQSQASCYRIVEQYHPAMLDAIRARIGEGRWECLASHWVENDGNLAAPAALCRHLAETRRYLAGLFGLSPGDVPVNWAPDTFGHAERTPSYLVRGGVKYQYLHRAGRYTPPPKKAFWWEAPDGSRVLAFNAYDVGYNARLLPGLWRPALAFAAETGLREWFVAYGIGDHGGGPTRRDLLRAREFAEWPLFPRLVLGTAKGYFDWLAEHGGKLPVVKGELNTEFTGCYTTQTLIKRANRVSENRLADAALAGALAGAAARRLAPESVPAWPADNLSAAWRSVLLGHFHDILPGSGVHDTRTHHHGLYQEAMAAATIAELHALRAFAARVVPAVPVDGIVSADAAAPALFVRDALGAGVGFGMGGVGLPGLPAEPAGGTLPGSAGATDPDGIHRFVVFNPTAVDRDEVVEVMVWDNGEAFAPVALKDRAFDIRYADAAAGTVRAQCLGHGQYWGHEWVRLAFPLAVPALGYAAVALCPIEAGGAGVIAALGRALAVDQQERARGGVWQMGRPGTVAYAPPEHSAEGLENEAVAVEIDSRTGAVRALVDKRSGLTVAMSGDLAALEFVHEAPHDMSAWCIGHAGLPEPVAVTGFRRLADGPWTAAIEVGLRMGRSSFTLTYTLNANDPRLHIALRGTWLEAGGAADGVPMLRWRLRTTLAEAAATCEVPFGASRRGALVRGEEMPGLEWAAVEGRVTVPRAGAGKFDEAPAGIVVATDSKYGYSLDGRDFRITLIRSSYHPDPLPEIGEHQVAWTVEPFAGALRPAEAFASARRLNHALRPAPASAWAQRGDAKETLAAPVGRFVKWSGGELCDFAPASDGSGIEVRAYEIAGKAQPLRLDFNGSVLGAVTVAELIDLNGHPTGPAAVKENVVELPLAAWGLAAARIRF